MSSWEDVFTATRLSVMTRAELISCGATGRSLTAAVRFGHLVRSRRDHYCLPELGAHIRRAIRVGGRLSCVSALATYGVFAYDASLTHIHIGRGASRLRAPTERLQQLAPANREGSILHWQPLSTALTGDEYRVGLIDALEQSVLCQESPHAVASIDSALNQRLIHESAVAELFQRLPLKLQYLRELVDGTAEAGQETVLRLIARARGLRCELQPFFAGIGRADILVERRAILEADSRAHHDGWEKHVVDRERDLRFARLGYPSLRPAYQHTMHFPLLVGDAIEGLVSRPR